MEVIRKHSEVGQAMACWHMSVLEALPFPVRVADAEANWLFVNDAAEKLFGIPRGDMLGKPCSHNRFCICGTDNCSLVRAKNGMKQTFFEHDGLSYRVDVELFRDARGRTDGFIEMIHDITNEVQQNEFRRHVIEATPLSCVVWDAEHRAVDCNEVAVNLYGFASKEEALARMHETYPKLQPDGKLSDEFAREMMDKAFACGSCVFEWMNCAVDGTPIPTLITFARVPHRGRNFVVGYALDLRLHKRMMGEVDRKNRMLQALNDVSAIMLASVSGTFDRDLERSLAAIAEAVQADRAHVLQNQTVNGTPCCVQVYKWPESMDAQPEDSFQLPREWQESLSAGQSVNAIAGELSGPERSWLQAHGILSSMLSPVFLGDAFWGFLSFDNCRREQRFTASEQAILRSASKLIGEALARHEMEEALHSSAVQRQRALAGALAQITRSPEISSGNMEDAARLIAQHGGAALRTSRVGIWSISEDRAVCRNIVTYDLSAMAATRQPDLDLSQPGLSEYVRLLSTERQIAIEEARAPNVLTSILDDYNPRACAMLDSPVCIGGDLAGVVCIEQDCCEGFPGRRVWTAAECDFASSLADLMAIAQVSADRHRILTRTDDILDNLPGMAFRFFNDPPHFTLAYVSAGSLSLLGVEAGRLTGGSLKTLMEFVHPDDIQTIRNHLESTRLGGPSMAHTCRAILRDGSMKWVWMRGRVAERAADGTPLSIEVFCSDITKQYHLQEEVDSKMASIFELQDTILETMARLVEFRDDITGGHVERTQIYLKLLIDCMILKGVYSEELASYDVRLLLLSAQLHDVGKIAIRDEILLKPGRLTGAEFELMKAHAAIGVEIIESICGKTSSSAFLDYAKILAGAHHERWDGTGYPHGLKGAAIPLLGRLMALVDVYDALTNERPYKEAFSHEKAVGIIRGESGKQFDPELVEVFLMHENLFANVKTEHSQGKFSGSIPSHSDGRAG